MDLTKIAAGLRLIADGLDKQPAPQLAAVPHQEAPAPTPPSAPPAQPAATVVEHPAAALYGAPPVQPQLTMQDLVPALTAYAQAHGNDAVIAILREFGVQSVSNIPQERFPELLARVQAPVGGAA